MAKVAVPPSRELPAAESKTNSAAGLGLASSSTRRCRAIQRSLTTTSSTVSKAPSAAISRCSSRTTSGKRVRGERRLKALRREQATARTRSKTARRAALRGRTVEKAKVRRAARNNSHHRPSRRSAGYIRSGRKMTMYGMCASTTCGSGSLRSRTPSSIRA